MTAHSIPPWLKTEAPTSQIASWTNQSIIKQIKCYDPLPLKNLKGAKDWIIAVCECVLCVCVCVCVAEPDEQSWPPWLPCSCTHCLQIRLGGVRGACGRRTEEVWGLSWVGLADTHTHTHTTNSIRFLFMSPSLPYSHYTVQQIMKNYIKKFISHSSVLMWTPAFHLLILHFSMKGKLWTCRHVTLEELGVCVSDASLTGVSHYEVLSNSATWR